MSPVAMGRSKRLRVPFTVTHKGEGETAIVILTLPDCIVTMDAADWRRLDVMFKGHLPSIFLRTNRGPDENGQIYLGITRPRVPGEPRGRVAMLSRVLLDAEDIARFHIHYRDGNRFNLCRSNLVLVDREAAAAQHTREAG